MSKDVFRNYDKKAIHKLLKEIGKEQYECALDDVGLAKSKPLTLTGFFIEWDNGNINLFHCYPSGIEKMIMSVLGFWAIPDKGWELYRSPL